MFGEQRGQIPFILSLVTSTGDVDELVLGGLEFLEIKNFHPSVAIFKHAWAIRICLYTYVIYIYRYLKK